jgi:hypothetical protein
MRLLLIIVGALAAIVCIAKPAEARDYPWCAYYNFQHGGATNCGWATFEQCLATVRGIGGSCGPNPQYQRSPELYLSAKPPRRHSY